MITPCLPKDLGEAHDLIIRMTEEQNRQQQRIAELEKAVSSALESAVGSGEGLVVLTRALIDLRNRLRGTEGGGE